MARPSYCMACRPRASLRNIQGVRMFDSGILDVAVGILFVFILVSTLCSAVREGVEAWLKTRASYLEFGLRELLGDVEAKNIVPQFWQHPMINGLFEGSYTPRKNKAPHWWALGKNLPSYIPAREFAVALIDTLARGPVDKPHPDNPAMSVAAVLAGLKKIENPMLFRALQMALDSAQGDLERTRTELEAWYNSAMDRVSGWYKRSTQWIIFAIAIGIAAALNVNTITIADSLYRNKVLRDATVASAEHGTTTKGYDDTLAEFNQLHLPIGWSGGWGAPMNAAEKEVMRAHGQTIDAFNAWNDAFAPLLGLLITAIAATLGAPFWFDVLNQIMVIRSTVKPEQKSPDEASADPQKPAAQPDPAPQPKAG